MGKQVFFVILTFGFLSSLLKSDRILSEVGIDSIENMIKTSLSKSNFTQSQDCYDPTWTTTADDYKEGKWKNYFPPSTPLLVYPFCPEFRSFGNVIGMYFNEASCAKISGAHFFMHKRPYSDKLLRGNMRGDFTKFFDAFPEIVVNYNPLNESQVKAELSRNCNINKNQFTYIYYNFICMIKSYHS